MNYLCNWFWGSHGCGHETGHTGIHECGGSEQPVVGQEYPPPSGEVHSRFDSEKGLVESAEYDSEDKFIGWGEPWELKGFQL